MAKLSKGDTFIEVEAHASLSGKCDWDAHLKVRIFSFTT